MASNARDVLRAAAILTGDRDYELLIERPQRGSENVDAVVERRLAVFLEHNTNVHCSEALQTMNDSVRWQTGVWGLACLVHIHKVAETYRVPADGAPLLGSRDLSMLKKLVAVTFAWLIVPAILAFDKAYPSKIDLDDIVTAFHLILRRGEQDMGSALPVSPMAHTDVAVLIVRVYLVDVLRVLVRMAYGQDSELAHTMLRDVLDTQPTITMLSALRSVPKPSVINPSVAFAPDEVPTHNTANVPSFVREQCARLLSMQLLRPAGVRSLFIAMLGAGEDDMLSGDMDADDKSGGDALSQRLDGLARLLGSPPKGTTRAAYYMDIVPHILAVLDSVTPPGTTPVHGTHRRAAAFTLMRMFELDGKAMLTALDVHMWQVLRPHAGQVPPAPADIDTVLRRLYAMVTLAPPAPHWIHSAVSGVMLRCLALDTHFHMPSSGPKAVDALRDAQASNLNKMLDTYFGLCSEDEIVSTLHDVLVSSLDDTWQWSDAPQGGVELVERPMHEPDVESLIHSVDVSLHADDLPPLPKGLTRSFGWAIDPVRICTLIKLTKRASLASALLLNAMDEHRRTRSHMSSGLGQDESASLDRRAIFFLQLVFQLFDAFGEVMMEEGDIDRVLHFIDFACHDDESAALDADLCNTALELLLSLLERHTTLTPVSTPMLRVMADRLERFRDMPNPTTQALSQELLMTLSARSKFEGLPPSASAQPEYLQVYHEALQYLQDPILPVRAHGLHLLTRLVSKVARNHTAKCYGDELDHALIPEIFDLFLHAIQDDESFLYLNAVQGLAQMATSWRDAVLRPLMAMYVGGDKTQDGMAHALEYGQALSQRETDQRLRIGEAILQVLQHLGQAVVSELERIVPPLLTAVRNPLFSATLRSSFILILGTCVEIVPTALAADRSSVNMVHMCTELIQATTETRPMRKRNTVTATLSGTNARGERTKQNVDESAYEDEMTELLEKEATSATDQDVHRPQLRRAALLLLLMLLRATQEQLDDYRESCQRDMDHVDAPLSALRLPGGGMLPDPSGRSKPSRPPLLVPVDVLGSVMPVVTYMAQEEADSVVRVQAQDCIDHIRLVELAYIGL